MLKGILKDISFRGSNQKITCNIGQITFVFEFPSLAVLPRPGSSITISFDPATAIKLYPNQ
jgi:hypothetical protein